MIDYTPGVHRTESQMKLPIYKKVLKDINFIEINQTYEKHGARVLNMTNEDKDHVLKILD